MRLNELLAWLCIILALVAIIWIGINNFNTWDTLLTPKQKFMLNWKPSALLVIVCIILWLNKSDED